MRTIDMRARLTRLPLALALLGALVLPLADAAPPEGEADDASEPSGASVHVESEALHEFLTTVEAWQLDAAREQIAGLPSELERELARGVLAVYEARYVEAEQALAGVVASLAPEGASGEPLEPAGDPFAARAQHFLAVARGAQIALGEAIGFGGPRRTRLADGAGGGRFISHPAGQTEFPPLQSCGDRVRRHPADCAWRDRRRPG